MKQIRATNWWHLILAIMFLAPISSAQDGLRYKGYTVKSFNNSRIKQSTVTVTKGKKVLARHSEGSPNFNSSNFELLPILGIADKQLLITQYSGGAHCCRKYWVYDLVPSFRLIFQSSDFNIGDGGDNGEGEFQNLDNDKELELVDKTDAFLYFDDLAYVSSPRPLLVFDYSHKTNKFVLSNKRFDAYILKDKDKWKTRALAEKETQPGQFEADVFAIFLDYVYAGKENEGWTFYSGEDVLINGWRHNEAKVRKTLNDDPAYRTIYNK